jgi:hypothetical protein
MAIKYVNIFQYKALQNLPNWDLWSENKPSGNPAAKVGLRSDLEIFLFLQSPFGHLNQNRVALPFAAKAKRI